MVERLGLLRIMRYEKWTVEMDGQQFLLLVSKIISPFHSRFITDQFQSLIIGYSWKRWLDLPEFLNRITQQFFFQSQDVVQSFPWRLGFHVPVLCEMASGPRFLRPEGGRNCVDGSHTGYHCFSVELPALREVGLLLEILHLEQCRSSFHRCCN